MRPVATATEGLVLLAVDPDAWVAGYLGALEEAGLLQPDGTAPPATQNPKVISLLATLATGILAGPAGATRLITTKTAISVTPIVFRAVCTPVDRPPPITTIM